MQTKEDIRNLGYRFKKPELLLEALTHPSFEKTKVIPNSNGLETFGDALLGVLITRDLKRKFRNCSIHQLIQKRAAFETNSYLHNHIAILGLANKVRVCPEIASEPRKLKQSYSKILEAIVGAIFIDCDFNWNKLEAWYLSRIPCLRE